MKPEAPFVSQPPSPFSSVRPFSTPGRSNSGQAKTDGASAAASATAKRGRARETQARSDASAPASRNPYPSEQASAAVRCSRPASTSCRHRRVRPISFGSIRDRRWCTDQPPRGGPAARRPPVGLRVGHRVDCCRQRRRSRRPTRAPASRRQPRAAAGYSAVQPGVPDHPAPGIPGGH